jgi:hypothetical protein
VESIDTRPSAVFSHSEDLVSNVLKLRHRQFQVDMGTSKNPVTQAKAGAQSIPSI